MGQRRIVEVRLPRETGEFGARVFQGLVTLGRRLTVELAELRRFVTVKYARIDVGLCGDLEHVCYLAFRHFDATGRDQHAAAKLVGVARDHFGREPSAERKADDIDISQTLLTQDTGVNGPKVAYAINPVNTW